MAEFGWAYLSGAVSGDGPSGSVQYVPTAPNGKLTGSQQFTWNDTSKTLFLSGTVIVSGTLQANTFDVIHTNRIELQHYGSSSFGDSLDDLHQFTGSVSVNGSIIKAYDKVTTAGSFAISNHTIILGVSGSGYKSITLPAADSMDAGRILIIKDEYHNYTRSKATDTHIAVSASSGNKVGHQDTFDIEGDSVALSLYSDGDTKWFIY